MGVDTNSPACAQLFFFSQDFTFRGGGGWSAVTPKPMSRPSRSSGATLLALDRRRGLKLAGRKVRLAVLSANRVGSPLPDSRKTSNASIGSDHVVRTVGVGHFRRGTARAASGDAGNCRKERSQQLILHDARLAIEAFSSGRQKQHVALEPTANPAAYSVRCRPVSAGAAIRSSAGTVDLDLVLCV